jgi:uncharacterized tellurite resistance protein B-like protein
VTPNISNRWRVLLAVLRDVAWADEVLRPSEARYFVDVVSRLDISFEQAAFIYREVLSCDCENLGSLSIEDAAFLDEDDKRWLLAMGYLMASIDATVDPEELVVLRKLATSLGVDWSEAQRVFSSAMEVATS